MELNELMEALVFSNKDTKEARRALNWVNDQFLALTSKPQNNLTDVEKTVFVLNGLMRKHKENSENLYFQYKGVLEVFEIEDIYQTDVESNSKTVSRAEVDGIVNALLLKKNRSHMENILIGLYREAVQAKALIMSQGNMPSINPSVGGFKPRDVN